MVSVFLLNYRRPHIIPQIITSIKNQTIPTNITLWNNGAKTHFEGVDTLIETSSNLYCLPRWHAAALLAKDYLAIIDDDLVLADELILEDCCNYLEQQDNKCIIGFRGKNLTRGCENIYSIGKTVKPPTKGYNAVDIIKGCFMVMHVSLLYNVPLYCPYYTTRGDDIWISLMTCKKLKQHHVPAMLARRIKLLKTGVEGLLTHPDHFKLRNNMANQLCQLLHL